MLESCGLTVITAESGEEAIKLFDGHEFFMVFMDINMPVMDGYETAEIIRQKNKSVPIIALSADEITQDNERFNKSGMNNSLLKPLKMEDLKELLNKYLVVDFAGDNNSVSDDSVFSYDELLAVMKNEKAVLQVLRQFISIHNKDCKLLSGNIMNGNFIGAREILHNITGISGNMFCKKLYNISCSLSGELKKGSAESLDRFSEIWEETFSELTRYYNNLNEKYPQEKTGAEWESLWDSFISLCRDFDISAVDIFSENMQIFSANMTEEKFRELKRAVLDYDFMWISDNMEG